MNLRVYFHRTSEPCWGKAFMKTTMDNEYIDGCIWVNWKLHIDRGMTAMCLLHEMVHLDIPCNAGHGPRFKARMRKLAAQGAMDRWW